MALILRDLYWAHGISSSVPGLDSTARDSLYRDRYQQVLARRGMSHDSLQEQLNYYLDHPQFLKAAQDQVVALLKEEQTQAEAQKSKAEASGNENDP
mgnify:CR=1 FL=1